MGRLHIQVTASSNRAGLLFHMIPDLHVLGAQLANDDPQWITGNAPGNRGDARRPHLTGPG